jgi:hypothetical protein
VGQGKKAEVVEPKEEARTDESAEQKALPVECAIDCVSDAAVDGREWEGARGEKARRGMARRVVWTNSWSVADGRLCCEVGRKRVQSDRK